MSKSSGPILVVEDVAQIRQLLEVTLKFEGHPVITASNGKEALERVAEEIPSLIITDLLMPKMDGYSLLYRLRRNSKTRSIPIVVLSATYVTRGDREFALSLGATKFMEKPVDTPEFLLAIGEILSRGITDPPDAMDDRNFYTGYRARLESKLHQKNQQVARTERLLESLTETQRPSFEALLRETRSQREQIIAELEEVQQQLKRLDGELGLSG